MNDKPTKKKLNELIKITEHRMNRLDILEYFRLFDKFNVLKNLVLKSEENRAFEFIQKPKLYDLEIDYSDEKVDLNVEYVMNVINYYNENSSKLSENEKHLIKYLEEEIIENVAKDEEKQNRSYDGIKIEPETIQINNFS
jgi:hypothetical protein